LKIVVDAMGGDYAPGAIVEGAIDAVNELGVAIALVGVEDRVRAELKKYKFPPQAVEVLHAPEVVEMTDPASVSIRKKKNSSISHGIDLLNQPDKYSAFVSAGNTGAVVAASTVRLRMLSGVERPGIGLVIPTLKGFSFLIDVGANTSPQPKHLLQSALMANVYSQAVLGVASPRIGLLNIGEEAGKGTDFAKETHKLLAEQVPNFVGNIEANGIFSGSCDCIICDGFVGNVVIKVSEALMESAGALLKREIKKSPIALFGAFLMKSKLQDIKRHADYSEYGGAPLLGVNGIVMISHGRSSPKAIKNAIRAAKREIEHNILSRMTRDLEKSRQVSPSETPIVNS